MNYSFPNKCTQHKQANKQTNINKRTPLFYHIDLNPKSCHFPSKAEIPSNMNFIKFSFIFLKSISKTIEKKMNTFKMEFKYKRKIFNTKIMVFSFKLFE